MRPRYVARVYRPVPETRWFRRHLLRQRSRLMLVHAEWLDSYEIHREQNGIANAIFVKGDKPVVH